MNKSVLLAMLITVLAGCSPVKVVNEPPPLDGCEKRGIVSAQGENEELVNRELARYTRELGGNVLFMLVTDAKSSPDGGAPASLTKYGIAFNCNPY
jgi:hypothetical protein